MGYARGVTGLDRATVAYGRGSPALRELTLLARPGEVLGVLGPSGSGKSTLLRAIAGLTRLDKGVSVINGAPTLEDTARRGLAMVFEVNHLFPFLDVAHNMSFPLDVRHVPTTDSHERVEKHASRLGITRLLPRKPVTLSSGEQARAGIGRALVNRPNAFLLDEPLAHLDAGERIRVRHYIREVVTQCDVPTFWVTHDQSEALSIGDRIAVLKAGELQQLSPAHDLYAAPANAFVADFVGTTPIALLPARLVVSGGMAGYQFATGVLPTWSAPAPELADYRDRELLVGIRAEDVHGELRPEHGSVTGLVTRVELTGRYATVAIRVGAELLHARVDGHSNLARGSTITVGVDTSRLHVFDARTGRALSHPSS